MTAQPVPLRACALLLLCLPVVSGCGLLSSIFGSNDPVPGSTEAVYRAAMADFSDCGTPSDPATRAALSARLATAAARLQAETRPTEADHFYMTDRVVAAAEYCAAAIDAR